MELLFDNLREINSDLNKQLAEFILTISENSDGEFDDENYKDYFLINMKRIEGLPAFYLLTPSGAILGTINFDHELEFDTPTFEEIIRDDDSFEDKESDVVRIKEIVKDGAENEADYKLLQKFEQSVKRCAYTFLLVGWYEGQQTDEENSEKLHQMVFTDLLVLDDKLSSMIDFMSDKDPDRTFNIVSEMIANNGLDDDMNK